MDSTFSHWSSLYQELRDNISPASGRFTIGEAPNKAARNKKIIDSTASKGLRTLKSGLMAGMTSPSRPWFRLAAGDEDAQDDPAAQEWAFQVRTTMFDVFRASNVYRMLNTCYGDIGLYGTFGGLIVPDFETVIRCHSFPMGSFRIEDGASGRAEYLHRDVKMTVGQVVKMFGIDKCSRSVRDAFGKGLLHQSVTVKQAIEPRSERDTYSPLSVNMPFASYYWESGENDRLLQESGYEVSPILAPRWETIDYEPYSITSPGIEALGDAIQLQVQQRDKAIAIKKSYDPPLQGSAGVRFRNIPGGVSAVETNDFRNGGLRPIYDVRPDVNGLVMDIQETQERIRSAFFTDLFLMTSQSDRRQITAREIAERHEEKLLALGPVLESLDHSLLQPLIETTFHYMQKADMVPPPPDSIANKPVNIEYISALAQAQKAVGVAPMERTIGFAATLDQIQPGAMDNVDGDKTLREFTEQIGAPPDMLRAPQDVEAMRKARAEREQQQALMEQAQPLANAAKLISEASARGESGIQQGAPF